MWIICPVTVRLLHFFLLVSSYSGIMSQDMESQKKNTLKFRPNLGLKLIDQVRGVLRYHHYAYRTEQTCCLTFHTP
jgi:hypothetical protein